MRRISRDTRTAAHFRDGVITIVVLLLVFAAFDDITTDNATTFRPEYSALIGCAAWLTFVAARLLREGRRILGALSALLVVASVWAQSAIVHGASPGLRPEGIVIIVTYMWFWGLSFALLWLGWRNDRRHTKAAAPTVPRD